MKVHSLEQHTSVRNSCVFVLRIFACYRQRAELSDGRFVFGFRSTFRFVLASWHVWLMPHNIIAFRALIAFSIDEHNILTCFMPHIYLFCS